MLVVYTFSASASAEFLINTALPLPSEGTRFLTGWYSWFSYAIVLCFCKNGWYHLMRIENEHSKLLFAREWWVDSFFDETAALVKLNLHTLLHNLANGDQVLRDGQYMQDILNVSLVTFFAEWNITDVPNQMSSIVSSFDIAGSISALEVHGTILDETSYGSRHWSRRTIRLLEPRKG